jgi:flagellar basal body-associated protein FliL
MEKLKIISQSILMFILIIVILVTSVMLLDFYFDYKRKNELKIKPKLVLNGQKITITNNVVTVIGKDTIYELHLEYVK